MSEFALGLSDLESGQDDSDYDGDTESVMSFDEDEDNERSDILALVGTSKSNDDTNNNGNAKDKDNSKDQGKSKENDYTSWNDEKLFPPSKRKSNNPSVVWQFGGLRKVNGRIEDDVAICGVCGKKITYKGSPGNFKSHLVLHHADIYDSVVKASEDSEKKQPKLTSMLGTAAAKTVKYPSNHPKQKKFRAKIVEWVVDSVRPFRVVEDKKLVDAFAVADPCLTVPSAEAVARDISKLYKEKKKETIKEFEKIQYFSVTTDAGTSLSGKTFIDVNVHWVCPETLKMKSKIIDVIKVDSKTAKDYRAVVDKCLDEHGIKEKVVSVTTDNEPTMCKCFQGEIREGCFAHIDSKASQKACESSKKLKVTRKKLRRVATKVNKTPKLKSLIGKEQVKRNLAPKTLKQEVCTRFTATHTMIRSIMNDPNEHYDKPVDKRKVEENVTAINEAMKTILKKKDFDKLEIVSSDISVMINIIPTLDILEEGIRLLGAESYCTGSSILPFLAGFLDILEVDEDTEDPAYVDKFKTVLADELRERCRDNLNFKLLAKCSFLDKRFANLAFLGKLDTGAVTLVKGDLIAEILAEMEVEKAKVEVTEVEVTEDGVTEGEDDNMPALTNPVRKKKAKFLQALAADDAEGQDNPAVIGELDPKCELERYQKEKPLSRTANPLQWWLENKNIYPLMFRMALKYFSVQGTSTAAERSMSLLGNILTKKRLCLTNENVRMLAYLSDCI